MDIETKKWSTEVAHESGHIIVGLMMAGELAHASVQTTSEHYLPLWGMKPTVLDQCNLLD
jgi:hypothetical protein